MKIENTDYNIVQDAGTQKVDGGAAVRQEGAQRQDRSGQADSVNISSTSQEIEILREVVNSVPDIRVDRVESVKAALQDATYNVSSLQIADKILFGDQG